MYFSHCTIVQCTSQFLFLFSHFYVLYCDLKIKICCCFLKFNSQHCHIYCKMQSSIIKPTLLLLLILYITHVHYCISHCCRIQRNWFRLSQLATIVAIGLRKACAKSESGRNLVMYDVYWQGTAYTSASRLPPSIRAGSGLVLPLTALTEDKMTLVLKS
jgi:hypothetical protein